MPDATPNLRRALLAACAVALAAHPAGAGAQGAGASPAPGAPVYKCVDTRGQVTYQQEPCTGGATGGPVQLNDALKVRPSADEAPWSAAAREGKPLVGMPKPFVTAAAGEPREIRAPRQGEGGSEVWVYRKNGQVTRIGFTANGVVAWIRSDAVPAEPPAGGPAAASATRPGDRAARVREALGIGKPCTAVLAEAGPADREEALAVGAVAGSGTRYVYTFDPGNANAYAAFVCIGGRVTSVERFMPGQ